MNKKTPVKKQETLRSQTNKQPIPLKPAPSSSASPVKSQDDKSQDLKMSNLQLSKTSSITSNFQESQTKSSRKASNINKNPINRSYTKKDTSSSSYKNKASYKSLSMNSQKTINSLKNQKAIENNKNLKLLNSTTMNDKMKNEYLKQSQDMSKTLGLGNSSDFKSDRKEENNSDVPINFNPGTSSKISDKTLDCGKEEIKSIEDEKNKGKSQNIAVNSPSNHDSSYLLTATNDGRISRNGLENMNSPENTSSINLSKFNFSSPPKDNFLYSPSRKINFVNTQNENKEFPSQDINLNNLNGNTNSSQFSNNINYQRLNSVPLENQNKFKSPQNNISVDRSGESLMTPLKANFKKREEENERSIGKSEINEFRNKTEMNKSEFNFKSSSLREGGHIQQLFLNKTQSNNFQIFETISKIENEYTVKSSISNQEDHGSLIPNLNLNDQVKILRKYCRNFCFLLSDKKKRIASEKINSNLHNLKERLNKGLNYPSALTFSSNRQETTNEKEFIVFPVNERANSPTVSQDGAERLKQILSGKKVTMNYSPIPEQKCDRSIEEELLDTMHISNLIVKNEKQSKIKEKECAETEIFPEKNELTKSFNTKYKLSDKYPHIILNHMNKDNSSLLKEVERKNKLKSSSKCESRLLSPQTFNNKYNPFYNNNNINMIRDSLSTAKVDEGKYDKFYKQSFKKVYDDLEKKRFNYNLLYNQISKPSEVLSDLKTNILKMKTQLNNFDNTKKEKKNVKGKDSFTFEKMKIIDNKLVDKIKSSSSGFSYLSKFFK